VVRRTAKLLSGHRLILALDGDLPLVRLDPVLFEQVLFNLLDNAGKYTPQGSEVVVRGRRAGDHVRISVEDQGEGLPQEDRERVFDKFYRVAAADRRLAGTGLGLSIARGFMEAMDGTVTAANRPEGGAIFTVTVPLADSGA
jgi:two-component system sensor histidine kinase KdpD